MKIKELKTKSPSELRVLLGAERDKLREFRFKIASEQFKNVRDIRKSKRTIARVLTLLVQPQKHNKS